DMGHGMMGGMDHGAMGHDMSAMSGGAAAGMASSGMQQGMDHAGMNHGQPGTSSMAPAPMATMDHGAAGMQQHPASEEGNPLVDMLPSSPVPKPDDPGIGRRDNGRRVLAYADRRSTFPDPDGREPGREIELHLTGHMERFAWSFDGMKFSDAQPLRL